METHFLQPAEFERGEEAHHGLGTRVRIAEQRTETRELADFHAVAEIENLFGEGDGLFLENRRTFSLFHEQVLEGEREPRHVHLLPDFFRGLARIRPGVNVVAEQRLQSEFAASFEETLVFAELAKQILRRKHLVVAKRKQRVRIGFDRKQGFRLPLDQRRRHQEEVRCDIEIQLLHQSHIGEVLVRDLRNRNFRDVELVALDQVEQKVERTFEMVDSDGNGYAMCQKGSPEGRRQSLRGCRILESNV